MASTRRAFLGRVTTLLASAIGAIIALPAVGYLIGPSLRRDPVARLSAGSIADMVIDQPVQREIALKIRNGWMSTRTTRGVWIARLSSGELRVYNPHCTHLGCAFRWDTAQRQFLCPCHGGVYDITGAVVAGPPPRALDTMDYTVEDNRLYVNYQDYRIGTSRKIPI